MVPNGLMLDWVDEVPLHVLVWNLTEEDDFDLQEYRPSVYELVDCLIARGSRGANSWRYAAPAPP